MNVAQTSKSVRSALTSHECIHLIVCVLSGTVGHIAACIYLADDEQAVGAIAGQEAPVVRQAVRLVVAALHGCGCRGLQTVEVTPQWRGRRAASKPRFGAQGAPLIFTKPLLLQWPSKCFSLRPPPRTKPIGYRNVL